MDGNLERLAERFAADPTDRRAFQTLEEHFFVHGRWRELVKLYGRRLEAPDLARQARDRSRLHFRLGQVLEERCLDVDAAAEAYQAAVRLDPQFRPAVSQLRRAYGARHQWDLVLQVAEVEATLPMQPFEEAGFAVEMGEVWHRRLADREQARVHFERALECDPDHVGALLGLSRVHEEDELPQLAAEMLERAVAQLRAPGRAQALVQLARLQQGALEDPDKAEESYRKALTDEPRNVEALEALVDAGVRRSQWDLVAELMERLFEVVEDSERRFAISRRAAKLQLDEARNPRGARLWLARALELRPDDAGCHVALAEAAAVAGDAEARAHHLARAAELGDGDVPVDVLLESARVAAERGDAAGAADRLRGALEREPEHAEALEALGRALERLDRDEELAEVLERRAALPGLEPAARAGVWMRLGALHEERFDDVDAAIQAYGRALDASSAAAPAAAALERLHRKASDWTALRDLLEARAEACVGRDAIEAWCGLGELRLEQLEDPEGARCAFESALAIDAVEPRALRGLERVATATGDEDSILEAFEREAGVTTDRARLGFLVWELVRILEGRGQPEEALMWIERLVAAAPEDREALEARARLQTELGHETELVDTLERLDVLLEGEAQAANRRRLAELARRAGDVEQAIAHLKQACAAHPRDPEALRALVPLYQAERRFPELADTHRDLAERTEGEERLRSLSVLADLLIEPLGDVDAAIAVLERLADEAQAPPEAERRLADLLEQAERYEELASRLARRRLRLGDGAPEAAELDRQRASLLQDRLGRPAEAAVLLRELFEAGVEPEATASALERALRSSGDATGLAALLARRAEATDDPKRRARMELERAALLDSPLERPEEARALLTRLADGETPVAAEAEERLQAMLERSGSWDIVRERLEARLDSAPDPIAVRERLAALCRDRLIDMEGAIEHLEAATEQAPERAPLWRSLARLYEEEERPRDLLRALEREIETRPDAERELVLRRRAAALCREIPEELERAVTHTERVLELEPGDAAAAEFLIERLGDEERHAELAQVLIRRLGVIEEARAAGEPGAREAEIALRLRIAALRAGPLDDPAGAIAVLEPATELPGALAVTAEPLADLLHRSGRREALVGLCRRAAQGCEAPGERGAWWLRLGDALRAGGDHAGSAEAYRQALADRPGDRDAQSALRDLYRRLGEHEPLARLLEAQLSQVGGREELPIRLELASLLEGPLGRPEDALVHLRRVLEIDPRHGAATERALDLAERLSLHEEHLALLDAAIESTRGRELRARRLARRGRLLGGPLARPGEAAESLRASLDLVRSDPETRRELRGVLQSLGDWSAVLECLGEEARSAAPEDRAALYDEAARIASSQVSFDAALPWLERLRNQRPGDASVLERIAEVHRRADRPEGLLRALDAQLAVVRERERRCALELERADLFELRLGAPARALVALEAAREAAPRSREVLERLCRLYARTGRPAEQVQALETLIEITATHERLALRRQTATLQAGPLARPERAVAQLWTALRELGDTGLERIEVLSQLGLALRAVGRPDLWAQVGEEELRSLDPDEPVFTERRLALHRDLARAYDEELARPDAALGHWRALVEAGQATRDALGDDDFDVAEHALLADLRILGGDVERAHRLEARLARHGGETDHWLELARLCSERLHEPARAARAYHEVVTREQDCAEALRGLRAVAERLGDWEEAARTLEFELEQAVARAPRERAALYRRLGEIAWRRLDSTTQASRAFASALETDPEDLEALRSLQQLFETMEDWRGAADLYESEVEVLGGEDRERRSEAWLRVGEIARDRLADDARALRAYEAAADLEPLATERRREWAELYERAGELERFAEVFGAWCDDPAADAGAEDLLRLAGALEQIGELESALRRAERAVELEPDHPRSWDEIARLREASDDASGAAEALARAGDVRGGLAAADRYRHAAELIRAQDAERAAELLELAGRADPACARTQAALAALCEELERWEPAAEAAQRALDLAEAEAPLAEDARLRGALAGARSARRVGRGDWAARLFGAALGVEPGHAEALAAHGEVLFELEDWAAARRSLERRLAHADADPERALHLSQLGRCLDEAGETAEALERYREALEIDGALDAAHEGAALLMERSGRIEEAVNQLQRWALCTDTPPDRAGRLLRAAELELGRPGRHEPAEVLLGEATRVDPRCTRAWRLLAELLWDLGRGEEALEMASRGLDNAREPEDLAALALVRGRALEQRGERSGAAAAYGRAADAEPGCAEGALAAARLRRGLGEWRSAADGLRRFVDRHPGGTDLTGVASALVQLGRLLAGPLEDVAGAIEVYRRALDVDESLTEAKEALAELLVHRPDHWNEAVERHRELLRQEPTRVGSLRALLRIAQGRGDGAAVATGLAILRALGVASHDERQAARPRLELSLGREPRLLNPTWECARKLAQEAADEIGRALEIGTPGGPSSTTTAPPLARFRNAVTEAEGRLTAPALVPLPTEEVGSVLTLVAQLAMDAEAVHGDGALVNNLSRQLGRRTRRKLKKVLEGHDVDAVAGIDFTAWRAELRALASASALESTDVELRLALLAWIRSGDDVQTIPPEADVSQLVAESPEARALLTRILQAWIGSV